MTKLDAVNQLRRSIISFAIPVSSWTDAYTPAGTYVDDDEKLAIEKVDQAINELQARRDWDFNMVGEPWSKFPYSLTADGSGYVIFTGSTWTPARVELHYTDSDHHQKRVEVKVDSSDSYKMKLWNETDQTFVWPVGAVKKLVVVVMEPFVALPQVARQWVTARAKIAFLTDKGWSQGSIEGAKSELAFAETSINNDNAKRIPRTMADHPDFNAIARPMDAPYPSDSVTFNQW